MRYEPGNIPNDLEGLRRFLWEELHYIAAAIAEVDAVLLPEMNVEPSRPREGMIVLADGTNWNPGAGAGFYGYYGGAWNKLG